MEDGVLVLDGAPDPDDPRRSYRQTSTFFYLTGVSDPGAVLLLARRDGERSELLLLPERRRSAGTWRGPGLSPGGIDAETGLPDRDRRDAMARTGFGRVLPTTELDHELVGLIAAVRVVYAEEEKMGGDIPPGRAAARVAGIRARRPDVRVEDLSPLVARLRILKSPEEIGRIEMAVSITCASLQDALLSLAPGQWEFEVAADVEHGFARRGAARRAFPTVVGSGPNSCILHHDAPLRRLEPGDLVVLDVGAEYGMYAADVTRTVPASGLFSPRQRQVYRAVRRAQEAAFARVKPGAHLRGDVHAAAVASLEADGLAACFPHGTSHFLGLDVHDVSVPDVRLEAGMVITVEPGVYLTQESIGLRIEDDVLVTPTGHRILSECLPREPEEIEALMAKARMGGAYPAPPAAP